MGICFSNYFNPHILSFNPYIKKYDKKFHELDNDTIS